MAHIELAESVALQLESIRAQMIEQGDLQGGFGDFFGLVASNLIAGECVLKEKKGGSKDPPLQRVEKSRGPDQVPEMLGAGGTSSTYFYGIGGE